jgi:hypothetical protein
LILITQPENYKNSSKMFLEQYNLVKEMHKKSNDMYREFAKTNKLVIVDLAKIMNNRNEFFYDEIHYNDKGSEFIGSKNF